MANTAAKKIAAARKAAGETTPKQTNCEKRQLKAPKGVWGTAAVVGGVAAVGAAATAALLALRGSSATPAAPKPAPKAKSAHQADGSDSSGSFEAGIADEGTIPA